MVDLSRVFSCSPFCFVFVIYEIKIKDEPSTIDCVSLRLGNRVEVGFELKTEWITYVK